MELTWPQIILYNHASWVNHERAERRYKAKDKKKGPQKKTHSVLDNKGWQDLTPEEQAAKTDELMSQL